MSKQDNNFTELRLGKNNKCNVCGTEDKIFYIYFYSKQTRWICSKCLKQNYDIDCSDYTYRFFTKFKITKQILDKEKEKVELFLKREDLTIENKILKIQKHLDQEKKELKNTKTELDKQQLYKSHLHGKINSLEEKIDKQNTAYQILENNNKKLKIAFVLLLLFLSIILVFLMINMNKKGSIDVDLSDNKENQADTIKKKDIVKSKTKNIITNKVLNNAAEIKNTIQTEKKYTNRIIINVGKTVYSDTKHNQKIIQIRKTLKDVKCYSYSDTWIGVRFELWIVATYKDKNIYAVENESNSNIKIINEVNARSKPSTIKKTIIGRIGKGFSFKKIAEKNAGIYGKWYKVEVEGFIKE